MKRLLSTLPLVLLLLFLALAASACAEEREAQTKLRSPRQEAVAAGVTDGPVVEAVVTPVETPPLRDLGPTPHSVGVGVNDAGSQTEDGAPAPLLSFSGMNQSELDGRLPPDPNGAVGPHHYVQAANAEVGESTAVSVYSKTGERLVGPVRLNKLFSGAGSCADPDAQGDPIVVYDQLADRWLLAQLTIDTFCVAVSETPDPTGRYSAYPFLIESKPDFDKLSVWPTAYQLGWNVNPGGPAAGMAAFDRVAMLAGKPAQWVTFTSRNATFAMPVSVDGQTSPHEGAPGLFVTFVSDKTPAGSGPARLVVYALAVDWRTPGDATYTSVSEVLLGDVDGELCVSPPCIPQPGTNQRLDSASYLLRVDWRITYRNFAGQEVLLGSMTVNDKGRSGILWWELRHLAKGWALHQRGTWAPDGDHRWMGSIAMDRDGNIGLGYSVSGTSTYPSIRYALHHAADPLGYMRPEATLVEGTGVQEGSGAWGDYSSMTVDPIDDCTFWYTNEYYSTTVSSASGWSTRIGAFRVADCGS